MFGEAENPPAAAPEQALTPEALRAKWDISIAGCEDMDTYVTVATASDLMTVEAFRPDFAGKVRYSTVLNDAQDIKQIELLGVGDTAELMINGKPAGRRICGPFRFSAEGLWQAGANTVTIVVSTTLGRRQPDRFSACMVSNPPGLCGPVIVYR